MERQNDVLWFSESTLLAVGKVDVELVIEGDYWESDINKWNVFISGVACTVNSVVKSNGKCIINIDYPILGCGAGAVANICVTGVKEGGQNKEIIGGISVLVA